MRRFFAAAVLAAAHTGAAWAASPAVKWSYDLRLRWEGLDTPARTDTVERSYDLTLGRARVGVDLGWQRWALHGVLQGAGVVGLPDDGAFAAGATYLAANRGDTRPSAVGLAELNAAFLGKDLRLVLGRQPYADGCELATGVQYLDGVKKRLLSDRLVGVFEWPSVGRRFDGVTLGYRRGDAHLAAFALRPLHGAFDHEDAFEPIDDLAVAGLTVTSAYDALPGTELRFFAIQYEDGRPVARRLAGGDLSLTTVGASGLFGHERFHLLVWGAFQGGDWGTADQRAWAGVVNVGGRLTDVPGKPSLSFGVEQSSGDRGPGGAHQTFFNVLPTNHKYYGVMDYVDFPNLQDVYLESVATLADGVTLRFAAHRFALSRQTDAWYGGSGAFEEESFGYAARLPPGGRFPATELGRELDLEVTWARPQGIVIGVGGGYFDGRAAAEAFLPADADGTWAYFELSWKM